MTAPPQHAQSLPPHPVRLSAGRRLILLAGWLLIGLLVACASPPQDPSSAPPAEAGAATHTPSITPSPTVTHSPTPAPSATATASPTITRTPTITATPTQTPFPWPLEALSPANAAGISVLKTWGQGAPLGQQRLAAVERLLLETSLGVYLYDPQGEQPVARLDYVESYLISPDGQLLVTTSRDRSRLNVWDLRSGAALATLEYDAPLPEFPPEGFDAAYYTHPQAMAFSPDGARLAVSYGDTSIVIWDSAGWNMVQVLESNVTNVATYLAFSPDNRLLLSSGLLASLEEAAFAPRLQIWDLLSGDLVSYIPNPGSIAPQPFSPDGQLVVTANSNRLLLWRLPQAELVGSFASSEPYQPLFSADGQYLIVRGAVVRRVSDGTRLLPDEEAQVLQENGFGAVAADAPPLSQEQLTALRHLSGLQDAQQLADRSLLAWGVEATRLFWWRLPEDRLQELELGSRPLDRAVLSPDRETLAVCLENELLLIDWRQGQVRSRLPGCRPPGVLAFLPDGSRLVRVRGSLIELLDLASGEVTGTLRSHSLEVLALGSAPDGSLLASGSTVVRTGAEVFLWQLNPPAISQRWQVSSGAAFGGAVDLQFSPDRQTLAVVMNDGFLKLYRVGDGWQLYNLAVGATAAAFSPDGSLLAIGTRQGLVLADADSGEILTRLPEPDGGSQLGLLTRARLPDRLISVRFVEGGAGLLTTASDGTVRLWGLP